jgi:hypothetical protein
MVTKNTGQVIKPIYHIGMVVMVTILFVILNVTGMINASTEVPSSVEGLLDFVLSLRSMYMLAFVLLLLAALRAKFKADYAWRSKLKTVFFFVLALFTGKFYTWAGFFFAWWIASRHVSYVTPIPLPLAYGGMSVLLGWLCWLFARSSAIALWKIR